MANELGNNSPARQRVKQLAEEALREGKPYEWFEVLYSEAQGNAEALPWGDRCVNPNLTEWLEENPMPGGGRKCLVVGCGLGDDAEALAALGFDVTAFDVAPTAIEWCRKRFPDSKVSYLVADALHPPKEWRRHFDFVFEAYTLQALPPELRTAAMQSIASVIARGGTLLVICRGCDPQDERPSIPWPLTLDELLTFEQCGLKPECFEDFMDEHGGALVRRFRILYRT
jgi:SAM-dependent methyltransferase